jgi:hypothetical protein
LTKQRRRGVEGRGGYRRVQGSGEREKGEYRRVGWREVWSEEREAKEAY